jgi:hypothetical protein
VAHEPEILGDDQHLLDKFLDSNQNMFGLPTVRLSAIIWQREKSFGPA